jgi:predicted small integral membrane protein
MLAETALSATFSTAISAEVSRATAAEGVLQSNIDVEKGRIDSILLASDADKDSFAEIVQLINSVDTTNDQAFASYVLSNDAALSSEVSRAIAAEAALSATFSAAISSEVSRATAAELVLTNDLATEVSRATAAESALTAALSAEEASRIAGDSALQASLNNEITDRIAANQALQSALDSETARAIAAEGVLTSDLATEVSRAIAAEAALSATFSAALSDEITRATFAELTLSNDLSDETAARIFVDAQLQSNIDVEKGRIDAILLASDADKDSFAEIVSLINSVDTTNDQAFASYVLSNNAALATEVSRALAAEAALSATFSNAISAEVSRATAAEAQLAADFANIYCKKVSVSGTPNGVLTSFTLASPVRLGSEMIYLNGLLMTEGDDYTTVITAGKVSAIEFLVAPVTDMRVGAYGVYGHSMYA